MIALPGERERWESGDGRLLALRGDSLRMLEGVPPASVHCVCADPPYSSGGLHRGDRAVSVSTKYEASKNILKRDPFSGDSKDQRSWIEWCRQWISLCRDALVPGGYCLVFSDWRQLPALTDAFQAADLVWRGIIVWDKGRGARAPNTGYYRHQCEYVVWGTKGPASESARGTGGPWDGCVRCAVRQEDKFHMCGKPPAVLSHLLRCVPAGGLVLDPFAGSGTSLVASRSLGLRAVGMEIDDRSYEVMKERLSVSAAPDLFSGIEEGTA